LAPNWIEMFAVEIKIILRDFTVMFKSHPDL